MYYVFMEALLRPDYKSTYYIFPFLLNPAIPKNVPNLKKKARQSGVNYKEVIYCIFKAFIELSVVPRIFIGFCLVSITCKIQNEGVAVQDSCSAAYLLGWNGEEERDGGGKREKRDRD
jgi:hypothetical protein